MLMIFDDRRSSAVVMFVNVNVLLLGRAAGGEHNSAGLCCRHRQSSHDPHRRGIICKICWNTDDTQSSTTN